MLRILLLTCLTPALVSAQSRFPTRLVTHDLTIDATTADLSQLGSIMVARNGTIAVAQPQDHLIRFFDTKGRPLGAFGRKGSGPGEFGRIANLGWRGDTLWAFDQGLSHFTLIAPNHKLLRTVPFIRNVLDASGKGDPVQVLGGFALYPDGSQLLGVFLPLARPSWARQELDAGSRNVLPRVSPDGVVKNLSAWAPADPCGFDLSALNRNCARPLAAISPDGDRIAFVTMATVGADSGQYRVTVLGATGDTVFARRFPFTARAIAPQLTDSLRAVDAARRPQQLPPGTESKLGVPKIFPPVTRVVIGRDGSLVLSHAASGATTTHLMLDPRGQPFGLVTLPTNVTLLAVARTELWGAAADQDGLQSIVRFRVR